MDTNKKIISNPYYQAEIRTKQGTEKVIMDHDQKEKIEGLDRLVIYRDHKGRKFARSGQKSGQVLLHRFLYSVPKGFKIRWKNGNTLDLRRENIELVNKEGEVKVFEPSPLIEQETSTIRKKEEHPEKKVSSVKGVYFHKAAKKWTASPFWNKRRYSLGYYETQEEAETVTKKFREEGPELLKHLRRKKKHDGN